MLGAQFYRPEWSRDDVQVLVPAPGPGSGSAATTGPPAVHIVLHESQFRPGDLVTIGLEARNPYGAPAADLYVGVIMPEGLRAMFVGPSGLLSEAVSLADAGVYPRAGAAAPGFSLSAPAFIELPLPVGAPRGTYKVFAILVKSRAARGQSIPSEDFLASAIRDVVVSP